MSTRQAPFRQPLDTSSPTLLIVSLITVLVGVAGVIAVGVTGASWAMVVTLAAVLAGLVIVARTMMQQLGEDGDDA